MIKKIIKIALIVILFAISILIFSKCNYAEMVDFSINKIEPKGWVAYVSSTIDSPPSKIKVYLLGHGEVYVID